MAHAFMRSSQSLNGNVLIVHCIACTMLADPGQSVLSQSTTCTPSPYLQ